MFWRVYKIAIVAAAHYMIQYALMLEGAKTVDVDMFEKALPPYLAHDLEAYKKGLAEKSSLLDCLWGELYGSINIAEINDGFITPTQAQYLRDKYLWGKDV